MAKKHQHLKLGIAIDDRTVRIAELEVVGANARLLRAVSATADSAEDSALGAAIAKALQRLASPSRIAHLAFADRALAAELVSLPQLKPADKTKVLERHVARMLNLKEGAAAAEFAARPTRQIAKAEGKLDEHLLVTAPRATIERYVDLCENAGIEIASVVPLAESLYAAFAPAIPKGVEAELFVDFGLSTTHLMLGAESGWLFSRSLAKSIDAAHAFSNDDLEYGLGGTANDGAEMVLELDEVAPTGPAQSPPAVPPLLLGEIRRSILFLEKELGVKVRGVALCGSLRTSVGLAEDLSAKLERPVRLAENEPASVTLASEARPGVLGAYAEAAGAAIAVARKDATNLLPLARRPQTGISWVQTGAWVGAAACLLGCLAFAAVTALRLPDLQAQVDQFRTLVEKGQSQQAQAEDPAVLALRSARQEALVRLRQNRSPIAYALEEISRTIPTTLALNDIKMFRDESRWFFRIEGKVKEKGSLEEIAAFSMFMKSLKDSPLFDRVEFTPFSKERPDPRNPKPDDGYASFLIVGMLKGVSG